MIFPSQIAVRTPGTRGTSRLSSVMNLINNYDQFSRIYTGSRPPERQPDSPGHIWGQAGVGAKAGQQRVTARPPRGAHAAEAITGGNDEGGTVRPIRPDRGAGRARRPGA